MANTRVWSPVWTQPAEGQASPLPPTQPQAPFPQPHSPSQVLSAGPPVPYKPPPDTREPRLPASRLLFRSSVRPGPALAPPKDLPALLELILHLVDGPAEDLVPLEQIHCSKFVHRLMQLLKAAIHCGALMMDTQHRVPILGEARVHNMELLKRIQAAPPDAPAGAHCTAALQIRIRSPNANPDPNPDRNPNLDPNPNPEPNPQPNPNLSLDPNPNPNPIVNPQLSLSLSLSFKLNSEPNWCMDITSRW